MAIKLTSTKDAARLHGVKILVHGPAGAGKTRLCATLPKPIIISAEAGLLSLSNIDIPALTVSSVAEVQEAYQFLESSEEGKQFETVCLDSLTEIAEVCLTQSMKNENAQNKPNPQRAYGVMAEEMNALTRAFRDMINRNVYMSVKQEKVQDEQTKSFLYSPQMPGRQFANNLPYMFDEVFALRVERDSENKVTRWLQTSRDAQYEAKDRSGKLEMFEEPDLGAIIRKIIGE